MSSCNGKGMCIGQAGEECYEGNCDSLHLTSGINQEDLYCRSNCSHNCQLVECHNFKLCGNKLPQILLDCHNGMCLNCAIEIGKIRFIGEIDDCPVCIDEKEMIEICCGKHKLCLDCWKKMSETGDHCNGPLACPLCREPIYKRKR